MKIFVTGICGYLGRALVEAAGQTGHELVGLDVAPFPGGGAAPRHVVFRQGSLEDRALVRWAVGGCEAMIHTAGLHNDHLNTADFGDYIHANVELPIRMLDVAFASGVRRFALASTLSIVLRSTFKNSERCVIAEDHPLPVGSPYGISKYAMEVATREWARMHDVPLALLRFSAFGHESDMAGQHLLAHYITERDAARACLAAIQANTGRGEAYNISSGTPLEQADIDRALANPHAALEHRFPGALEVLQRHGRDVSLFDFYPVFDITKAKIKIGYAPEDTFENWLCQHGWQAPRTPTCPTKL